MSRLISSIISIFVGSLKKGVAALAYIATSKNASKKTLAIIVLSHPLIIVSFMALTSIHAKCN